MNLESLLKNLKINTIRDLIFHFPREYQDGREIKTPTQVELGQFAVVRGKLEKVFTQRKNQRLSITKGILIDKSGMLSLVWFNQPYMKKILREGREYIVSGKIEYKYNELQINAPEMELVEEGTELEVEGGIIPVYSLTAGISQKVMKKLIYNNMVMVKDEFTDIFSDEFRKKLNLLSIKEALETIHNPGNMEILERALLTVRFEEAFLLQMMLLAHRRTFREGKKTRKYTLEQGFFSEFQSNLRFELTPSQKKVIEEIEEDIKSPFAMNRLLQGDVGSGKTVVCIYFTLMATRSGYQTAIMAPTEILAEQHYYEFRDMLKKFSINMELLTRTTNKYAKERIKQDLEAGLLPVVVGTHALIQEDVRFKRLGLMIIDEQHKFGVMQRTTLKEKGETPDCLYTTATPIPRSLCLTLYGDLDLSVIDELPPGRTRIKTLWVTFREKSRVYCFIEDEIKKGGQAYIICPLIEESENLDATPLMQEFEEVRKRFPGIKSAYLHGRMRGDEKETIMEDFRNKKFNILVSTTVVEVGVDIPDATVMVILNAERYGLGQLHQLRGRVGRSDKPSTCILISSKGSDDAGERLKTFVGTQSGFEIAEADLKLRGPGDYLGVRQAGISEMKFIDIVRDYHIIVKAREEALLLEKEDPFLEKKENQGIRQILQKKYNLTWDIIH